MTKSDIKVGDRIFNAREGFATITEITERGFAYTLDQLHVAHPRLGIKWDSGECYLDEEWMQVSCHWTLAEPVGEL